MFPLSTSFLILSVKYVTASSVERLDRNPNWKDDSKLKADSGNIAENDHSDIVNGSYSFLKNFDVKLYSKKVYDFNEANEPVKIKNLLQYIPVYAESTATDEFFYLNSNRNAEERAAKTN